MKYSMNICGPDSPVAKQFKALYGDVKSISDVIGSYSEMAKKLAELVPDTSKLVPTYLIKENPYQVKISNSCQCNCTCKD
jgi:hypothetical protein